MKTSRDRLRLPAQGGWRCLECRIRTLPLSLGEERGVFTMMKMAGDLCSRSQTERLIWDQAQGIRRHSAQHQCHSRLGWSNSSWCSTVVQQELFITHSLFRTGTQPASKGGSYNWAWGQTTWSSIAGVGLACSNLRSSRGRLRLLTQSSRCRSERLIQAVPLSLGEELGFSTVLGI